MAVCNLTTRRYTQILGKETGADPEAVYKELTANTMAPATFVPAGIVAVTRAQERGYSLVSIGWAATNRRSQHPLIRRTLKA